MTTPMGGPQQQQNMTRPPQQQQQNLTRPQQPGPGVYSSVT